jgi:valyl-tRNA synthetase
MSDPVTSADAPERAPSTAPDKFLKPYDHLATEDRVYQDWQRQGFFNPDTCIAQGITKADAPTFSIVLPPPNVTGTLHTGHALMLVIEDIMVRHARMQGKRTLWLPGTDHAAIATQSRVEKDLAKEGVRKHDLGRDEFLKKVDAFAQASHDTIVNQVKKMGASIDWSREAFTLDEKRNFAVRTAFKRMYDDGLIYRKEKVVNWDPKGQTTISDDEIIYEERPAKLYTFKYSKDFPIPIATTRPETKVGDVAVAVHPEDERYAQYVGQIFEIADFCGVPLSIKIVADAAVEKEFGTGAVGVTPSHSQIDADIASRHNLPFKTVINEYAKMVAPGSSIDGMKTSEAREAVGTWLEEQGLLTEPVKDTVNNVSTAERTGAVVEPLPKLQWWIDVNKEFTMQAPLNGTGIEGIAPGTKTTLKKVMAASVRTGQISILPGDRFERMYFSWIDNLRDWCISRQIWYGHRIPVWYRGDEIYNGIEAPEGDGWTQDEDTLDTWFSSGLWTFSTLGWPDPESPDLAAYHPTDVIETGADIIFFWVARMVLMSGYLIGEVPFKTVYLHGLVRDAKGRKISKSLGNGIDPLELIEKYGADALRMSLIVANGPGNDLSLGEDKIKAYRKFSNKLWNVARFVLESIDGMPVDAEADASVRASLDAIIPDIDSDMNAFRYHLASEKLYHYVWHEFADKIIEESKAKLQDPAQKAATQASLLSILSDCLKLLHPFMPHITEEIWSHLPNRDPDRPLIVETWPAAASVASAPLN